MRHTDSLPVNRQCVSNGSVHSDSIQTHHRIITWWFTEISNICNWNPRFVRAFTNIILPDRRFIWFSWDGGLSTGGHGNYKLWAWRFEHINVTGWRKMSLTDWSICGFLFRNLVIFWYRIGSHLALAYDLALRRYRKCSKIVNVSSKSCYVPWMLVIVTCDWLSFPRSLTGRTADWFFSVLAWMVSSHRVIESRIQLLDWTSICRSSEISIY